VRPVPAGGDANSAFSSPSFVPERGEIWYSDGDTGFYAVRLTNGVWPMAAPAALPAAAAPGAGAEPSAAAPAPASASASPRAAGGPRLPATGLALPIGAAAVLLLASLVVRRVGRTTPPA
jgi:hypothetical protein